MAVHHAIPQALIPAHAAPQQDKPVRIKTPLLFPPDTQITYRKVLCASSLRPGDALNVA